ncbi:hypothetical protein [Pannonibacter sp. I15F10I1]|uniref:hypothetical protein n=1 Tax=Pannonibacter sp. I15F10I1 TaxID=2003580 RepID=UPI00164466FE|nr:hypothetical protein [Pannonibacter sp. I15F10I1]
MRIFAMFAIILLGLSLPSFSFDAQLEHISTNSEDGTIHYKTKINSRVNNSELETITRYIYESLKSPDQVWIGFFLDEYSELRPWATATRNFNKSFLEPDELDKISINIHEFSLDEWNSFGRYGKMYPPDAELIGLWDLPIALDVGMDVSLYAWNDITYLYRRYKSDKSGQPVIVTLAAHPMGTMLKEPYDEEEFWLLKEDETIERHDKLGLIPGWQGLDVREKSKEKSPSGCEIRNAKVTKTPKKNDRGKINIVTLASVEVYTDAYDFDFFTSSAKDILEQFAHIYTDEIEITYYHTDEINKKHVKQSIFYVAYTPDPSKLVYREQKWTIRGHSAPEEIMINAQPRHHCKVKSIAQ